MSLQDEFIKEIRKRDKYGQLHPQKYISWLEKKLNEAREDNAGLRELLWLRHGCKISGLYGDDGEMQCGNCIIDFKRDSAKQIKNKFFLIGLKEKSNNLLKAEE